MAYNASSGSRNFGDIRFEDDTDTQLDWSADSITFKTNDVARFVINNDGIGIGVANPSSSLDVEGNVTIGATFSGKNAAPTNGLIVEQSVGVGQASPASDNSTTHFVHIGSSSSDSSGLVLQDNEGKWEIYNNGWLVIKDGTESIAYFKHTGNKEMVLTKNLQMLADSTVLSFGAGEDVTFTHDGGTGMDIVSAGSLDIGSTAGSMTIGSVLADGQTLKLGKNGAVETIIAPHGTAGSEKYSVTNTAGTAVGPTAAAIQLAAVAGGIGIRSTANLEGCIQIEADGGADETISIHSDQGTGHGTDAASNASINLISDSGGIALSSGRNGGSAVLLEENGGTDGQINIHADTGLGRNSAGNASAASISIYSDGGGIGLYSGNDSDNAIRLETNGGAGETIVIHSNQGTGEGTSNASIQLLSDVGGIDLTATGLTGVMTNGNSDAAVQLSALAGGIGIRSTANLEGCIQIEADGGANETISVHSDQGTGVNTKGGSTDASINLVSDAGGIGLYTALNADNAITLETNGGANETIQIRSNQGTGVATAAIANAVNASIALVSDAGGVALASGLNADGSIFLEADGGTDETIVIHSNQGTGEGTSNASIQLLSDVGGIDLTATGLTGVMTDGNSDAAVQISALAGGIGLRTTSDLAGAIQIEADGGTSETIIIKSDQGTGLDSIQLVSDAGGVTVSSDTATFSSANSYDPLVIIKNTTNDKYGARLRFVNDKGAAGAADDICGQIEFYGDDANQDQVLFASITGSVAVHTNGQEGGKLILGVASHDGELNTGLLITDGSAEDEVDVTIGNGADSLVTIAGDLDIPNGGFALGSDASGDMYYRNSSGVLTRIAVGSDNHVLTLDGAVPGWEAASGGSTPAADDITTGDAAVSLATTSGTVTVDSQASSVTVDGHTGVNIVSSNSGEVDITSAGAVDVNATTTLHMSGTAMTVTGSGAVAVNSTYGSITIGSNLADGQTLKLGKNGAVETIIAPHGTAGSELYSVINTAGITDGSDAAGSILLSSVAGGIGLAWADDKDLWAEGGRAVITANENAAEAIKLHADAGANQTIQVINDAGTTDGTAGAGAIDVEATAGGISLLWNDAKDLWAEGGRAVITANENAVDAIKLHADAGANQTINIVNDAGTAHNAIILSASAGGIDVNAAGAIHMSGSSFTVSSSATTDGTDGAGSILLSASHGGIGLAWSDGKDLWAEGGRAIITANENAADCIKLHADAGSSQTITVVNDAGTSVTEGSAAVQLTSTAGGVGVRSAANLANAVNITADGGTSSTITVFNDQGTAATEGAASIQLLSDVGGINIKSGLDAANAILLTADGGTSETIVLHSDQGTGLDSIKLLSDAGGVTVAADTTTFESSNAQDPLVIIKNTTNDAAGARLRFVKDKGGAGAANDVAGSIEFVADDANQDQVKFASITGSVAVHTNGQEGGKLTFGVASHDGEMNIGLAIQDGSAEDEVDVTIGNGADSLTTIAGDLDIPNGGFALGSDASGDMYYRNGSGVLTRIAVGSDNHVLTLDGAVPGWEAASGGGSGDVSAGSTFTTAGVIMACDGSDKTIDEPGATLTTNGQDMTIEGGDLVLGLAANTNATTIAPVASSGTDAGKTLTISAGASTIGANNINGGDLILKTGGGDGTGTASIQFWSKVSGTDAAAERMRIGVNGNVGINETTPKTTLSVTHDYNSTTFETQLSDGEGGGRIMKYSPGADDTLTVGQLYFLHTDGTWDQCDADAVATGASQLLGVGMGAARAVGVLLEGFVRIPSTEILNTPGSGAVDGLPVYVSTTAGHFDFTAPSGAGDFVRVVGYAIDDDSSDVLVYFNPDSTWVEL
jgi:hypothetical protein